MTYEETFKHEVRNRFCSHPDIIRLTNLLKNPIINFAGEIKFKVELVDFEDVWEWYAEVTVNSSILTNKNIIKKTQYLDYGNWQTDIDYLCISLINEILMMGIASIHIKNI